MDGFINLLKSPGMTSHDCVQALRRLLTEPKIGHGGTLDPEAAGVLPVMVGQATKLSEFLLSRPKTYRAEIVLGVATDTGDGSGRIIRAAPVTLTPERLEETLAVFRGTFNQRVPRYAAVHHQGRRLYELARRGVEVETPVRQVTVYSLVLLEAVLEPPYPRLRLEVTCSAGTYIRSLGADIGERLGCGAYLRALVRTVAGALAIEDSFTLEEIAERVAAADTAFCLPPDAGIRHLPAARLQTGWEKPWLNGNILGPHAFEEAELATGQPFRVYDAQGRFRGVGVRDDRQRIRPKKVFR